MTLRTVARIALPLILGIPYLVSATGGKGGPVYVPAAARVCPTNGRDCPDNVSTD